MYNIIQELTSTGFGSVMWSLPGIRSAGIVVRYCGGTGGDAPVGDFSDVPPGGRPNSVSATYDPAKKYKHCLYKFKTQNYSISTTEITLIPYIETHITRLWFLEYSCNLMRCTR